jgi:hypothetical protein
MPGSFSCGSLEETDVQLTTFGRRLSGERDEFARRGFAGENGPGEGGPPGTEMRSYVVVTGIIFGLLTVAHVWRIFLDPHLATDPWFLMFTIAAAALAVAAWRVARRSSSI